MGYVMTPMKIDIGGIALGALIGLGAILIVPKLAHILGSTHGYRSTYVKESIQGRHCFIAHF